MGYTLIDTKWHKKDSLKAKDDDPKATRVSADSASQLIKEARDIKTQIAALESNMLVMQESIEKVLQLSKDTSTDPGKLYLNVNGLKKDGVRTVSKLIKQVDSSRDATTQQYKDQYKINQQSKRKRRSTKEEDDQSQKTQKGHYKIDKNQKKIPKIKVKISTLRRR